MSSSLGIYIENNIIKYAKLSKDRDNVRIDSFGIKFYDDVDETIKQIISETYSYKTPITVNLSDEKYTYAQLFSLLNKKDLERAVETEFEYFCNGDNKNRRALEYRRLLVPNLENKDKITSIYAYTDKSDIVRKLQILDAYTVRKIVPLPLAITNLSKSNDRKNCIIVNIEKNTTVTTVVNGQIQKVDVIDSGMKEILDSIIIKENSYAKAYEICKNTTIYTSQGRNLQIEENEYLEDIMPTLYKITERLKEIIRTNEIEIGSIYITGLAAVINNIDLYFQENFPDKTCEILTPFFINRTNVKLNIKDYIEVNSAVSLALQGLDIGIKEINFKKSSTIDQFSNLLKMDIGGQKSSNKKTSTNPKVVEKEEKPVQSGQAISLSFDNIEKSLLRSIAGLLILLIAYVIFSTVLFNKINKKDEKAQEYIADTQSKISEIDNNKTLVQARTNQYESLIQKIDEINNQITESYARKNAIPNFLTQIMFNIPKEVQLVSIQNTSGKAIKIEAQSEQYEQLGYFVAKIKNEGILTDVKSTSGIKQNEYVKITINGNLPY